MGAEGAAVLPESNDYPAALPESVEGPAALSGTGGCTADLAEAAGDVALLPVSDSASMARGELSFSQVRSPPGSAAPATIPGSEAPFKPSVEFRRPIDRIRR